MLVVGKGGSGYGADGGSGGGGYVACGNITFNNGANVSVTVGAGGPANSQSTGVLYVCEFSPYFTAH